MSGSRIGQEVGSTLPPSVEVVSICSSFHSYDRVTCSSCIFGVRFSSGGATLRGLGTILTNSRVLTRGGTGRNGHEIIGRAGVGRFVSGCGVSVESGSVVLGVHLRTNAGQGLGPALLFSALVQLVRASFR